MKRLKGKGFFKINIEGFAQLSFRKQVLDMEVEDSMFNL